MLTKPMRDLRSKIGAASHHPVAACSLLKASTLRRYAPFRKSAADIDFLKRRVADELESLVSRRRVRHHPVTNLMAAVAGVADVVLQGRGELRRIAVREQLDAGSVECLIDLAHARFTDEVAEAAGREHCYAEIFRIALDRLLHHRAPGETAPHRRHRIINLVDHDR